MKTYTLNAELRSDSNPGRRLKPSPQPISGRRGLSAPASRAYVLLALSISMLCHLAFSHWH